MASSFDLYCDTLTATEFEREFGDQWDSEFRGHEATTAELRAEYNRAWPVDPFAGDPDHPPVPGDPPAGPPPAADDDDDLDDNSDPDDDFDSDPDDSDIPF